MTFHVKIAFFGIFGVVPDQNPPNKLMLLVPATDCNKSLCTPAPDNQRRFRHRWFIDFDPRQVVDAPALPGKLRALWNLYKHQEFRRITFAPTFETSPPPADLDPQNALAHVADISRFASKYAKVLPTALTMTPGPEIAGQILIQHGQLVRSQVTRRWWFPGTLEKEHIQDLHHGIDLQLTGLTSFEIHSTSSSGADVPLKLTAPQGEWVKLEICNLCDRNPLRWETEDEPRVDDDFRWYFELSEKKADLETDLSGRPLPVPHPLTTQNDSEQENRYGLEAAIGHNCFSAQFQPQSFP